jgi:putative cardiolipin synthase
MQGRVLAESKFLLYTEIHTYRIPALVIAVGCCLLAVCGCATLPTDVIRQPSYVISDVAHAPLDGALGEQLRSHPGQSGVFVLESGLDALIGRALLARMAEGTIDLQYYIFHQDTVGQLILYELLQAADRGVRVRMLIDDMYGSDADNVWAALDAHPGIEVRLFNPFARGTPKLLQFAARFHDLNHRMHSKSFTADNLVTIVGGRNIGDEYYQASPNLAFADLDVLVIGPVAHEVSAEFDQYWNSDFAYPASALAQPASAEQLAELRARLSRLPQQEGVAAYIGALKDSKLAIELREGSIRFDWAQARILYDPPEKQARGKDAEAELLISQLKPYIEKVTDELIIVSPYFVPGEKGSDFLCMLSKKGVKVPILTNSLASSDVFAVHSGYARYREKLLRAGVELYELDEEFTKEEGKRFTWLPGLSKGSLHGKFMVFDKKAMFVGSMNLDQRSLHINNEIGILFLNSRIAGSIAEAFDQKIKNVSFQLELYTGENGMESIRWRRKRGGEENFYYSEPYVGFWEILGMWVITLLPVESLL